MCLSPDEEPIVSRGAAVARAALAMLFAPALVGAVWINAIFGIGDVWIGVQPGGTSHSEVVFGIVVAMIGPVSIVVGVIRSRLRPYDLTGRILRIETWGLIAAALPFPLYFMAMSALVF
jgi:hypothetical protein